DRRQLPQPNQGSSPEETRCPGIGASRLRQGEPQKGPRGEALALRPRVVGANPGGAPRREPSGPRAVAAGRKPRGDPVGRMGSSRARSANQRRRGPAWGTWTVPHRVPTGAKAHRHFARLRHARKPPKTGPPRGDIRPSRALNWADLWTVVR